MAAHLIRWGTLGHCCPALASLSLCLAGAFPLIPRTWDLDHLHIPSGRVSSLLRLCRSKRLGVTNNDVSIVHVGFYGQLTEEA